MGARPDPSGAASSSRSSATPGSASHGSSRRPSRLRCDGRARALPALRRGDHLLAGRRGAEAARRSASDEAAVAAIRSLLGESDATTSAEEIAWAFRKTLEHGRRPPLVVVFDDIQWGDETFLDLVEHVALSPGRRSCSLCMARPELVERRPTWPVTLRLGRSRRTRSTSADRRPPPRDDCASGSRARPAAIRSSSRRWSHGARTRRRRRPAHAAGPARGTPRPARDASAACSNAARSRARSSTAAPSRRCPESRPGHPPLAGLVRKELIRPDRPQLRRGRLPLPPPADPRRRLRRAPKAVRAELHVRFAAWLEEHGSASSSSTRSSATTSSRRAPTAPSSGCRRRRRWPPPAVSA